MNGCVFYYKYMSDDLILMLLRVSKRCFGNLRIRVNDIYKSYIEGVLKIS